MNATLDMTVGEIVAADCRTAAIFQRHGVDCCCHGGRTLEQGCRDAGVSSDDLLRELDETAAAPAPGVPRFNTWDLPTLVSYIVANHHAYVREALPLLVVHTRTIAEVHGGRQGGLQAALTRTQMACLNAWLAGFSANR